MVETNLETGKFAYHILGGNLPLSQSNINLFNEWVGLESGCGGDTLTCYDVSVYGKWVTEWLAWSIDDNDENMNMLKERYCERATMPFMAWYWRTRYHNDKNVKTKAPQESDDKIVNTPFDARVLYDRLKNGHSFICELSNEVKVSLYHAIDIDGSIIIIMSDNYHDKKYVIRWSHTLYVKVSDSGLLGKKWVKINA